MAQAQSRRGKLARSGTPCLKSIAGRTGAAGRGGGPGGASAPDATLVADPPRLVR
jgi:hypothetical protein